MKIYLTILEAIDVVVIIFFLDADLVVDVVIIVVVLYSVVVNICLSEVPEGLCGVGGEVICKVIF